MSLLFSMTFRFSSVTQLRYADKRIVDIMNACIQGSILSKISGNPDGLPR